MSVPSYRMVCQLATAIAILVLAGVLWERLPRYQFFVTNYSIVRGNLQTGELTPCYPSGVCR